MDSCCNKEFLDALNRHNSDAEHSLVASFHRSVQIKLHMHLQSHQLVEDASQEVFVRLLTYFRKGNTLQDPAALPAFIHSVCWNVAMEHSRAHRRHAQLSENAPELPGIEVADHSLIGRERADLVRRILYELSDKDRELLQRAFLNEEDKDRLCKDLRVARSYLRVLLFRARARFKAVLEQDAVSGRKYQASARQGIYRPA
jgi:RNA polymerase sigma-70 factor (ECF subfamily)